MSNEGGLKSALDLAMERLAAKDGQLRKLTPEQKKAIGKIERTNQAKIAETEIMFRHELDKARSNSDAEKAAEEVARLESKMQNLLRKIRDDGDREKENVRNAGA